MCLQLAQFAVKRVKNSINKSITKYYFYPLFCGNDHFLQVGAVEANLCVIHIL